jgi:hypothetical protein
MCIHRVAARQRLGEHFSKAWKTRNRRKNCRMRRCLRGPCRIEGGSLRTTEHSQSRETVKHGHEPRGTRNQGTLCWLGPAAI